MPGRLLVPQVMLMVLPLTLMPVIMCSSARGATATATFTVTASLTNGCVFGSSLSSPTTNLGTINFGSFPSVPTNVDVVSTSGAGSVVVTCTPGTTVAIGMDYGIHGGSATQRYMANSGATATLGYQLYQNAARTVIWGTGAQAMTISSFPSTTQTYPVYGRLFSFTTSPTAGTYTDTVTVTLTY
ncbi:spore coat U domain-containing protein [Rahnella bruchi]|uniref:Csu type fimbrial protein n=2 Tax=Rahnella bruchi TaxID=1510573 RepID=UPI000EA1CA07|nr:spore coat U domain-containing protein [Rahnella bruchi]